MRLLALLLGLLLASLLGEIAVRLFAPQDLSGSWRVASLSRGYPLNRAGGTARHALGDRVVHYRFNRLHMRGPEPGRARQQILCLGDSMTFGWRLAEEDTYVRLLEGMAEEEFGEGRFEFLNGGAGGWGTAHYLAFLEEFGERIGPEAVLVFVSGADISRSQRSGLYAFKGSGPLDLEARSIEPSRVKEFVSSLPGYQWLLEHSHLFQATRNAIIQAVHRSKRRAAPRSASQLDHGGDRAEESDPNQDPGVRLGRALFKRMQDWCSRRGVALWVLTTGFQVIRELEPNRHTTSWFLHSAPEFFATQRTSFGDLLSEVCRRTGGDLSAYQIPNDLHPNESGARIIAEAAWPWVRRWLAELPDSD